ncbi:hypothetical protein P175DRAFT_0428876 [Aspergillus ochraceoroseus IBT 24754]|uniref:Uncharacterized protein n=1 Tax=Aspergillus ochraceoroseus IBT 24754 TaxID=1392256 RepID=A0A2T5M5A5_9EURO|nr:uncharacterized protein P175DRAFT_0428876 [Aspergillus ochraceoroseus IBT 24754]PTU23728.1 hypothetical protein P175DRAFT_0428876 [Aspergillus ochraceoroseus IBT 24754]
MADYDVIIIGAGISGINAAYRLQTELPHYRYTILEARDQLGGTWDLFKYPGIRSDSDLFTFGFAWHPWDQDKPIAEGPLIVDYLTRTTQRYGIDRRIQYQHRVRGADWSSADHTWSLTVEPPAAGDDHPHPPMKVLSARFLIFATGYYDYHTPLPADIPGLDTTFQGQVVHPQFWPEDLDYTDKRIVVIGSGATAITLLPKLAERAAHVTMLQRSPTYILTMPNREQRGWSLLIALLFPAAIARRLQRLSWLLTSRLFFLFCHAFPLLARFLLRLSVTRQLPASTPYDPHFNPRYNPWDQRLCVCPDGDFFRALHTGRAAVKTATIQAVTPAGIQLHSAEFLPADIIVPATGLRLQIAGGVSVTVDDSSPAFLLRDKFIWHGMMLQDLPNVAFMIGYTNASWTLGADATARAVCRLLQSLDRRGCAAVVPRAPAELQPRRLLNLSSTYVVRAEKDLPRAGDRGPWVARDNYWRDLWFAKWGDLDEAMEFLGGKKDL